MKTRLQVFFRRIGVVCIGLSLMTMAFWMLNRSSGVVKAQSTLGSPIPNLTSFETTLFTSGLTPFKKIWDPQQGLGPVFTQTTCTGCHASPVPGGNSSKKATIFGTVNSDGTFNPLTSEGGFLLQQNSVAQFKANCVLAGEVVPADATINIRHMTPQAYGMGLLDSIPDSAIQAQAVDKGMGIHGQVNWVPDETGVFRPGKYGYKDQFVTLLQIMGQALAHDLGVTNPVEPIEDKPQGLDPPVQCTISREPNDDGTQLITAYHYLMYLAPNTPGTLDSHGLNGQALFHSVGCDLCHLPTYTTADRVVVLVDYPPGRTLQSKALSTKPVNLYSDLLLHDMGLLGDGLPTTPGNATGTQFRTTPLWGLSTRTQYLHDGRSITLDAAIRQHSRSGTGEAVTVIGNYTALSSQDQADLQTFINSL